MPRLLVLHPHSLVTESWRHAVLALGCPADVTQDRDTALRWTLRASRAGQLGMLLIVDDSPVWRARDIIRDLRRLPLRRQVPVLVLSPAGELELADREHLNPANDCLSHEVAPEQLLLSMALLLGRSTRQLFRIGQFLPGGRPWSDEVDFRQRLQSQLIRLWQNQQLILAQGRLSAGGVAAARGVLEHLLANRMDESALPAARELLQLAGGPRPVARWAARWSPPVPRSLPTPLEAAGGSPVPGPRRRILMLRVAGQQLGVPMDRIGRAFWWDPTAATGPVPADPAAGPDDGPLVHMPLSELLGSPADPRPAAAGLWLELSRQDGHRVLAAIDEVIAYATLECQLLGSEMRRLSGVAGTARAADGSSILLPDLSALLSVRALPVGQRQS